MRRRIAKTGREICGAVGSTSWPIGIAARYIGVTSNLAARVWAHREGRGSRFCGRYGLKRLVYAELAPTIGDAIAHEKAMKKWNRAWKIELIERINPDWDDLFETINQ